ncbi:MAG: hypothetical protein H5T63_05240 [Chloroflexi bacterium]|nr:hypothetical protein [Chloroflexota bacterium]
MTVSQKDRALTSLLWGAVAAVGQYTMLFLTIIRRIHVHFEHEAPVFSVDPQGLIPLTKDMALSSVWIMAIAYGLLITFLVYFRPHLSRGAWIVGGVLALTLSVVAALADYLWGLIVLASFVALYPVLAHRRKPGRADE